jgi:ABC-type multidrug transport system fused ATPase/permease subunit
LLLVILAISCIPSVIISNRYQDAEYRQKTQWMTEGVMVMHLFSICFRPWRMKEVRCFGLYDYLKDIWRNKSLIYQKTRQELRGKYLGFNIFADILRIGVFIGALLIACHEIYKDPSVGLGVFMLVFSLSGQFQDVVTNISVKTMRFFEDITYMRDFFKLDDLEREPFEANAPVLDKLNITCENVTFAYPGSNRNAINGLSVDIKQGEKIAIVGENGSGKSTFVNMLLGFCEPQKGIITANGDDLQSRLTSVRRSISAVFQEFGHYDNTIRENICISNKERKASDTVLASLARKTGAYEFIETQPCGFDEMIGTFSAAGNNLSGGQWQKLALTRALYRDKAKMIILDEPTAALDPIAEASLYRDFAALTGDKTTILISHRLGITSVVDRILVFSEGRIVEDGSHAELMDKKGIYAAMYQAQAQWYQ